MKIFSTNFSTSLMTASASSIHPSVEPRKISPDSSDAENPAALAFTNESEDMIAEEDLQVCGTIWGKK